ncbi:patatin-like phospholipase family protein [Pseudomonas piscis]|uniref:patatin-like phospholipase family protein n=1 Tax=Pseudomonas piscis TaxID=2614538 RepID=UPI0021D5D002|nr:patatin-like phospholipase family protein [Pseudomonas piscis]MCU7647589.1 patatin-like phospholipase family protein [Pseudomonas piscis]
MTPADTPYQIEQQRIRFRRLSLQQSATEQQPPLENWGLALSGGGIRSATFGLGVLQALARAPVPDTHQANPEQPPANTEERSLLSRFDYLSTVSGGGYIGSFFSSLFLPGRLRPADSRDPVGQAARDAYQALRFEPPGRISTGVDYAERPVGQGPTAWLRENGRYLTPTGAGDMLYALAMTWRNWLSLHAMLGLPIVLVLSLLSLFQVLSQSSLLLWPLMAALLFALPCAVAYWLVIPRGDLDQPPRLDNAAYRSLLALVAGLWLAGGLADSVAQWHGVGVLALAAALVGSNALLITRQLVRNLANNRDPGKDSTCQNCVRNYRVQVTRALGRAMAAVALLVFLALLVSGAELLYGYLQAYRTLGAMALLVLVMWLVRRLVLLKDEKPLPGWMRKLPLDVLALIAGGLLLALLCLGWALLVQWVAHDGGRVAYDAAAAWRLLGLSLLAALLVCVSGRFIGFLNTSSLQAFYSARLTRAYLGASNGRRFNGPAQQRRTYLSVAEPMSSDDLSLQQYYATPTAGPVHLINVTMNLTVDPAEQLVQRDRKGQPLCIAPNWAPALDGSCAPCDGPAEGYTLDGKPYRRDLQQAPASEIMLPLSLGGWIGVSGAAFSTGLGRATSLGMSLVLGLANVRLGIWWPSRFLDPGQQHWVRQDLKPWTYYSTQAYLFYELTARFHGHRRDYQYLSDGGHFENTATYELLRQERQVRLIVTCDSGCDPDYRFDDLANLVRLARIDQALEIREDPGVLQHPLLKTVFASQEQFRQPPDAGSRQCALLLNVHAHAPGCESGIAAQPHCRILVLKPRLIAGLAPDVRNYARNNPGFPNQSTVDQFFDEAQFESYRQLGLEIGQALFGQEGQANEIAQALWRYLDGEAAL